VPAGHDDEHDDAPGALYVPDAHAWHAVLDVDPAAALAVPAAHSEHPDIPATELNEPGGH